MWRGSCPIPFLVVDYQAEQKSFLHYWEVTFELQKEG
jgi:hypothetical protein